MPFPTVKSNPYSKGIRQKRKFMLWPGEFWIKLARQAQEDKMVQLSPRCLEMICEINRRLYGKPKETALAENPELG